MNTISAFSPTALAPQRPSAAAPPPPGPRDTVELGARTEERLYPFPTSMEKVGKTIDDVAMVTGTLFWGAIGGTVGALAGALAGGPVGLAVGGGLGALGLASLYATGHGDKMGKLAMGAAAVGAGALLGSLGGPTGTVVGAGLGAAYAGAGLYFSWAS